jgi:hypothetical protein
MNIKVKQMIQEAVDARINTRAIELAKDDDYSSGVDLFDCLANEDEIRQLVNKGAVAVLQGRHPDNSFELAKLIYQYAAEFYTDEGADCYDI